MKLNHNQAHEVDLMFFLQILEFSNRKKIKGNANKSS